jgi:hypothetical protein
VFRDEDKTITLPEKFQLLSSAILSVAEDL